MEQQMKKALLALCLTALATATAAMTEEEIKEFSAFLINTNGYLCAEVISISPTSDPDIYRIRCVEYSDGSGSATYLMNALQGTVIRS